MIRSRTHTVYWLVGFFWIFSIVIGLCFGSVMTTDVKLILELRVPRVILSSAVGMGLAVAGTLLQALFANPLCEPYTLGVSSGAALGVVIALCFGLEWSFGGLAGSAFLGALFFSAILYWIVFRPNTENATLLLIGVMLGFFGSSLVALFLTLSTSHGLQSSMAWMFGDLSHAQFHGAAISFGLVTALTLFAWFYHRQFDALLLGEEDAQSLGISVQKVRQRTVLLSSLLIAVCVSGGGMIGFVGLVVPHVARRLVSSLHCHVLPLSAILGAAMLTLGDCFSRVLLRPYELPVGVITALVGAPCFISLIWRRGGR
jgi:iron complex transport system permease protein